MRISAVDLGKKFETRWIFKNFSIDLSSGDSLAITGSNGSGKSTLLQIMAYSLTPSAGKVEYYDNQRLIKSEDIPTQINFSAPYVELVEEFSLKEHLDFHSNFHTPMIPVREMMERMGLAVASNKPVRQFSSGMKQRLRLALTFYFNSRAIFLDEPTSNLDESGVGWYLTEVKNILDHRTILIASNQRYEYDFCKKTIQLEN
ncbi:MAG: ATP-binding cassette domain-containing protein [Cytophagales bacterium]|nr:ATP-binding cassette domain-containing protein [Cytophagales bacterium]